jgi:hypothetical protein
MNSVEVFEAIEKIAATSARSGKERILAAIIHDELVGRVFNLAYDPFVTFGIIPGDQYSHTGSTSFDISSAQPWVLLHQLTERKLTGKAASVAVERMLDDCDEASGELLRRILLKDLRCGVSEKTINRFVPALSRHSTLCSRISSKRSVLRYGRLLSNLSLMVCERPVSSEMELRSFSREQVNHFQRLSILETRLLRWFKPQEIIYENRRKIWTIIYVGCIGFFYGVKRNAASLF